jgi:hypothetical protein
MKSPNSNRAVALLAFAAVFMVACSDSTGPTSLDSDSALQSLAIGLTQFGDEGSPTTAEAKATFDAIAPLLDKVSVTFDGVSQDMYALAIRQTFPPGTCLEAVFIDPQFPSPPGECTPAFVGVETVLWQTRSASRAPDKLIVIIAEVGTNDFDRGSDFYDIGGNPDGAQSFPALAIYIADQDKIYGSESGTITTSMTSTGPSCDVPIPPYAKSATCSIARFAESGSIVMSEFALEGPTGKTLNLGIPSINMDGLWIDIIEVQPITFGANPTRAGMLGLRGIARAGVGRLAR